MKIPYIQLNIHFEFLEAVDIYFMEALIRGALGHHLKRLVCINKREPCEQCFLRQDCAFALAFFTDFENKVQFNDINNLPHPYLILYKPVNNTKGILEIIFFEKLFKQVNYFVYTFLKMGEEGIGKQKIRFVINQITDDNGLNLYDPDKSFIKTPELLYVSLETAKQDCPVQQIQVQFTSPLRLKSKGQFLKFIDFIHLAKYSLIRLTLLSQLYGEFTLESDEIQRLLGLATQIKRDQQQLDLVSKKRYSKYQDQKMNLGGLTGLVQYSGNIYPFLKILEGGGLFGIGKNTTFGCGRYNYRILK